MRDAWKQVTYHFQSLHSDFVNMIKLVQRQSHFSNDDFSKKNQYIFLAFSSERYPAVFVLVENVAELRRVISWSNRQR